MVAIGLSLACLAVIGVAGLALFSRHVGRKVEAALPPLGRFLDLGDTRIHYLDEGAGPPVLLVHGLGGQMRNFTPLRQALQQQGFRTIAIDRPGSGYSTRPSDAPATPMAQARIVAEVVRWLGLEQPLILGHSLGGAVALAVALDFPDAVGGLVLLAPLTQPQAGCRYRSAGSPSARPCCAGWWPARSRCRSGSPRAGRRSRSCSRPNGRPATS